MNSHTFGLPQHVFLLNRKVIGMKAQIKDYHGAPTIFLDDQPVFGGCQLLGSLDPNFREYNHDILQVYAKAGIHIYSIDSLGPEWCGPSAGHPGHYDFSVTAPRLQEVIDADPQALFLLRMGFETRYLVNNWWNQAYPQELEVLSDGTRPSASYASTVWQSQVKDLLTAYIDHLRSAGLYDRVIAYQIATGTCGEWIKDWSSMDLNFGDYSAPMRHYFQAWLAEHYHQDVSALQAAWNLPDVTFATAEVPSAEQQKNTSHYLFRDPSVERNVIDFYDCYADLAADALIGFCHTVKEVTQGEKLAGAFFGYLMELSWNDSFFNPHYGTIDNAEISTTQRSGHLGLKKALRSADVDFFVSPYSYGFRGVGGDGLPMQPTESLRVHNKLYLLEEDSLMHNNFDLDGRMQTTEHSIPIYQRNFAQVMTHSLGITWLETSAFREHPTIVEETHAWLKRFQDLGQWSLQLDRSPSAETAVFLDDESFYYQTLKNNITLPLIWQQRVVNLNRFGAPHDLYLLDDLLEDRLPPYKLYVFLNPFHLNDHRRAALKRVLRQQGRTALWIYAPGYLNADAPDPVSIENMTDLTGFRFGLGECYWGPFMHITNFDHPITRGLPQDMFWGSTHPVGPLFHLDDPEAVTLGQVVYSSGRCKPGMGVKTFHPPASAPNAGEASWTSVYIATPTVPAPLLRGIARYAGVHLYSEAGDVIYATPDLLTVHTVAGGMRVFKLPQPVEAVYDLYNDCLVGANLSEFTVHLPPASTSLFYTGTAARLENLPHPSAVKSNP